MMSVTVGFGCRVMVGAIDFRPGHFLYGWSASVQSTKHIATAANDPPDPRRFGIKLLAPDPSRK
jgi:hypothetical protein